MRALVLFCVIVFSVGVKASECATLVPSVTQAHRNSAEFIQYLVMLIDLQVVGPQDLKKMQGALSQGQLVNPIDSVRSQSKSELLIHYQAIANLLKLGEFDLGVIKDKLRQQLKKMSKDSAEREVSKKETAKTFSEMVFLPIGPGKFKSIRNNLPGSSIKFVKDGLIELTHSIEMSQTPVTQYQWTQLMGANPAQFVKGHTSIVGKFKNTEVNMQPELPMENITWWSAIEYANRLSIQHGLKPAYIFQVRSGRAKDGTLTGQLFSLEINAPDGDIYRAEGYRLPTRAEMEYVLRQGGKNTGTFITGDDIAEIKNYAWYFDSGVTSPQPVALLKPLVVDGKEFFDVSGNVLQWTSDGYDEVQPDGIDPWIMKNDEMAQSVAAVGGCYKDSAAELQISHAQRLDRYARLEHVGFRLVRTLDPQKSRIFPQVRNLEELKAQSREMKFHTVPAGQANLKNQRRKFYPDFKLAQDFYVMDAPVTQAQWVEVIGENNSANKIGWDSVELDLDGKKILLQPNHAVTLVTEEEIMRFANHLSEEEGLKPVYIFNREYKESGMIKLSHTNIYKTEGYRLPTQAELAYLRSHVSEAERSLEQENVEVTSRDVSFYSPQTIFGYEFFEMFRGTPEWTWDAKLEVESEGQVNPLKFETIHYGISHGTLSKNGTLMSNSNLGFRLVRSVKKP